MTRSQIAGWVIVFAIAIYNLATLSHSVLYDVLSYSFMFGLMVLLFINQKIRRRNSD